MPRSKKTTDSKPSATAPEAKARAAEPKPTPEPTEERQSQFATILIGLLIIASGLLVYNYFQSANSSNTTTTTEQAQNNNKTNNVTTPTPTKATTPSPTPTPTPSSTPTAPAGNNQKSQPSTPANSQYTVQSGDSLWSVAEKTYGDGHKWDQLARANNISSDAAGRPVLQVGQVITLPGLTAVGSTGGSPTASQVAGANTSLTQTPSTAIQIYTVRHGDTLWSIAQAVYGQGAQWHLIFDDPHNRLSMTADGQPLIHAGNQLYLPDAP